MGVVNALRAIDAYAHKPTLVGEEPRGLVGNKRCIGLNSEIHRSAIPLVAANRAGGGLEEVQPGEKRFAALENDAERIERHRKIRGDHPLQHIRGHNWLRILIKRRLVEIEAIVAREVA